MSEIPTERILLRFTQALVDKQKKYMDSLKKGIVSDKDAYVLAINAREIPHARFGNTMPFFVQAFLPIGPLAVAIDPTTATMVESFYQYREQVKKLSGESVSTRAFLDPEFAFCSAVLHSAVDCVNRPRDFGGDFCVLHNPNATHQLDQILFSGARQLSVRGGELVENEVKS